MVSIREIISIVVVIVIIIEWIDESCQTDKSLSNLRLRVVFLFFCRCRNAKALSKRAKTKSKKLFCKPSLDKPETGFFFFRAVKGEFISFFFLSSRSGVNHDF